ncbi:hypothetical protein [Hymenobacter cellulosivorans]|uniref:Uncharacterized protein n=1 Tax=Hymenobacter cellulosivorans TaxID=2932249 RepID=A0ABY4FGG7_9BACT|nr:hypothetical protein [Hymenobacter cellulosivorans]UOQ55049.1 hypothetical protein MUN80_09890 [Hymenobacter cellulosivorans]
MRKALYLLLLGALSAAGCQPTSEPATPPAAAATTTSAPTAAASPDTTATITTQAQALEAVDFYLHEMPEGGQYNFDSAKAQQVEGHWLVLVPSIPGEGRKPNTAVFDVGKQSDDIRVRFVPRTGE